MTIYLIYYVKLNISRLEIDSSPVFAGFFLGTDFCLGLAPVPVGVAKSEAGNWSAEAVVPGIHK